MKKYRLIFLLVTFIVMFFNIGFSSFVMNDAETFYDYELSNNTDYYVTIDYNDGHTPDYIYHLNSSRGAIDIDSLPSPINELNHTFNGWYTTKDGFNKDGTSSKYNGEVLSHNSTLYAKYVNKDTSLLTNDMNVSMNIIPSDLRNASSRYYISSYGNEIKYSINLNPGSRISLHYADNNGEYDEANNDSNSYYKFASNSKIIGVLDSNLIIEGGTFQVNSILGGNTSSLQALISNPNYTALDLNGYNLIIRNGGILNGFGIIYNSKSTGGIICENGSIYTPFLVYGFKGGGLTGASFAHAISPFENYLCPYLSCETIFTTSGKLYGATSLYANSKKNATTIQLIGNTNGFLIQVNSGYLIRRQTPYQDIIKDNALFNENISFYDCLDSSYREIFIFTNECESKLTNIVYDGIESFSADRCNININTLSMSVNVGISLNVSMKYVDFPIPSFFDMYFYNTDLDFNFSIIFMPGSTCFSDEFSVIKFKYDNSGSYPLYAKITALEKYAYSTTYQNDSSVNNNYCQFPEKSIPNIYCSETLFMSTNPSEITINGSIVFDTSATIKFSDFYKFYSIGGRINLSQKALETIKENAAYIKLCSDIPQTIYYAYGSSFSAKYCLDFAQFNTLPLISNNKAYIQTSEGGEVLECNKYDIENSIYYYQGEPYFYLLTNNLKFLSLSMMNLSSYTSNPTETNTINKYKNNYGIYIRCSDFVNIDTKYSKLSYLIYSGEPYLLINNGYIKISSIPTLNEETDIVNNISLANSNLLSTKSTGIRFDQTAFFDYKYLKEWRLTYA